MLDKEQSSRWLAVRRRIIEHDFAALNAEQRSAVMATEGPLLLLAGAGSGKTTVIINRIANLIRFGRASDSDEVPEEAGEAELAFLERYADFYSPEDREEALRLCTLDPADPWRIMAITFTNKAADELKSRLEAMLGEAANDIWAATFHSVCVRILRRDVDRLGVFTNSFTIYDTADSQSLVKRILKELDLDEKKFAPRSILSVISAAKDERISAEEFLGSAGSDPWRKVIGQVYREYTRRLIEANAMDFDDLLLHTVELLEQDEEVLQFYRRKFRYLLVDEYQDTNMLQYRFVSLLAGDRQNICVVGDDDQGIYKFRGATIENILSFEKQFKGCRVIRLEQNYRSTEMILNASNAVISNNTERKGKTLWTKNGRGEKLSFYEAANENDEAQYVASRILSGFSRGGNWSDYAVLYRMNAQSNQLEHAFKRNGVPYRVYGGMKFYDRAEIKDMMAYLCVVNNPEDDLRLRRIVNVPPRGIGDKTIETAAALAASEGLSLFKVMARAKDYPELKKSAAKLSLFTEMIGELRSEQPNRNLDDFYDLVVARSGYLSALESKDTQEDRTRAENVKELKTNIIEFIKSRNGLGNLSEFLDEMALYTDLDELEEDAKGVTMMTMHSAKGLEFPNVFIVGAEEGIFPGMRAIGDPEAIEEERRLCYVAMTRAKQKLTITMAKQRMLFGQTRSNSVSRFVKEIPEECMEKVSAARSAAYGGAYGSRSYGEARGSTYGSAYKSGSAGRGETQKKTDYKPAAPKPAASLDYRKGDCVEHKAFGKGVISSMTPMGGDHLIEIIFDKVGTKRLMLRSAAQYMKKVQ